MGGSFFLRQKSGNLKTMLNKEQNTLEEEKERLRKEIKNKAIELSAMEGSVSDISAFFLKPMGRDEIEMVTP